MKIITSRKTAERFLADLFKIPKSFVFIDNSLSQSGRTSLEINTNGQLTIFSYGTNWCDQEKTVIEDAVGYIYRNRKYINKKIKLMNYTRG